MKDLQYYITSGILEAYCLGMLDASEAKEVEHNATQHPEVQSALDYIYQTMEKVAFQYAIAPRPGLKRKILTEVYRKNSGAGKYFPPLVSAALPSSEIRAWLTSSETEMPAEGEFVIGLSGDLFVTNMLVRTSSGHEAEIHHDFNEFIVVLEGACIMTFGESEVGYSKGDIIAIPLNIYHSAKVTSEDPMLALVQRQLL